MFVIQLRQKVTLDKYLDEGIHPDYYEYGHILNYFTKISLKTMLLEIYSFVNSGHSLMH